jgi:epoxyqueuosine reductase
MPTSISKPIKNCTVPEGGDKNGMPLVQALRRQALALGFDAVGITGPDATPQAGGRLDQFLTLGRHGDMAWLEEKAARRRHPNALWPWP